MDATIGTDVDDRRRSATLLGPGRLGADAPHGFGRCDRVPGTRPVPEPAETAVAAEATA